MSHISNPHASSWRMTLSIMLGAAVVMFPDVVLAAATVPIATTTDNPMGDILCAITGFFKGNTGRALATIAVTVIGIGALMGKVSWGMAIMVGVGVAVIFGAAGIVNTVGEAALTKSGKEVKGCASDY